MNTKAHPPPPSKNLDKLYDSLFRKKSSTHSLMPKDYPDFEGMDGHPGEKGHPGDRGPKGDKGLCMWPYDDDITLEQIDRRIWLLEAEVKCYKKLREIKRKKNEN